MPEALSVRRAESGAREELVKPQTAGVEYCQVLPVSVVGSVLMLVSCFQLRVNALTDFVRRYTVADG